MIKFNTKIKKLEQKSRTLRAWKDGDDVKTETEDLGWYLLLEGSRESLYVGRTAPELDEGDPVVVTIARR
jgi:hypothetical protein